MHIERRRGCELPRQSCRLGRVCVLRSCFGFVRSSRAKEVRREVGHGLSITHQRLGAVGAVGMGVTKLLFPAGSSYRYI